MEIIANSGVDRRMVVGPLNGATCFGDSGGPLIISTPNGPRQVGVVSRQLPNQVCSLGLGGFVIFMRVAHNDNDSQSQAWRWGAGVINGIEPPVIDDGPHCEVNPNPFLPPDYTCTGPSDPYCTCE
jgi:hypothetical protein